MGTTTELKDKLSLKAGALAASAKAGKTIATTTYVNTILQAHKNQLGQIMPKFMNLPRMANIDRKSVV